MMVKYATLNPDGTVYSLGQMSSLPEGAIEVQGDLQSYVGKLLIDGQWMPRPQVADPIVTGNIVRFEGVPDGAVCEIIDCDFNSVAGQVSAENGVIEFQLADVGTYQLFLTMPLPWINKANTVVIT